MPDKCDQRSSSDSSIYHEYLFLLWGAGVRVSEVSHVDAAHMPNKNSRCQGVGEFPSFGNTLPMLSVHLCWEI